MICSGTIYLYNPIVAQLLRAFDALLLYLYTGAESKLRIENTGDAHCSGMEIA
jgi:hypothetical protein